MRTRTDARGVALAFVARLSDLEGRFTRGALLWRAYTAPVAPGPPKPARPKRRDRRAPMARHGLTLVRGGAS